MLTYRTGAAGATGAALKMADHLLEQTLPIPARDLAAYYQRGVEAGPHNGTVPEVRRDMAPLVAELLRLDPNRTPTRDEIAHVLAGRRADGEDMPGHARQIAYIDLCFSADKSVALAWAFAPTEAERNAVAQAHRDAVEAAMAYVSTEIGQARRGKAGKRRHRAGSGRLDRLRPLCQPTHRRGRADRCGRGAGNRTGHAQGGR